MDEIFLDDSFTEQDKFVDVGCGKGRVLAYLIKKGAPCSLTGIELNKDVAEYAQNWANRYDNSTKYTSKYAHRSLIIHTLINFKHKYNTKPHSQPIISVSCAVLYTIFDNNCIGSKPVVITD